MAKFTGDSAEFTLDSNQYLCLTDYSWSETVEEAVARCSGASGAVTHRNVGAADATFTFNILTEAGATGITNLGNLRAGSSGAFEFHPEGDTAGNIEFDATTAYVTSVGQSASTGNFDVTAVTIAIDGTLTIRAAS